MQRAVFPYILCMHISAGYCHVVLLGELPVKYKRMSALIARKKSCEESRGKSGFRPDQKTVSFGHPFAVPTSSSHEKHIHVKFQNIYLHKRTHEFNFVFTCPLLRPFEGRIL